MSESTLFDLLIELKEWHILTANKRVNIRKKVAHTKRADTIIKALARIDKLEGAIKKWLDGDYPNPRRNRPHDCPHGQGYWMSCDSCETEYWQSVLPQPEDIDPTPYCARCHAMDHDQCDCGPIADNH
jgi:hypothetical protein